MFKWKLKATNAIYLEDANGQEGRPFKSRFLQAGLVKYDFGVCLLKKETIDKFVNTFVECPVIIDHKDNITENDVVGTIQKIWFSSDDGWFWCSGVITNEKAINLIENGYNVSCQYRITDYSDNTESKLHNANPYDKEILDGVFEHLAIVENPRYEDAFIAVNAYIATNNDFKENEHPRDEEGKFTDGNSSSFYNDKTKTIELKGDELGSSEDEIRENGLKYFKEKYQGKKFDNPELKGILFSNPGIKKFYTNSADIHKIKAIPALKDIIEKGEYKGAEDLKHPREGGIVKFHRINHNVTIGDEKENMSVLIGEDKNGNRFYNLNNRTYTAENSSRGNHAIGEANEEFSINIIAHNSGDFNPNFVKLFKATLFEAVAKEFIARNSKDFDEIEHPRDKDGKFTKNGTSCKQQEINQYPGGGYTNDSNGIKRGKEKCFQDGMNFISKHRSSFQNFSKEKAVILFELFLRGYDVKLKERNQEASKSAEDAYTFVSNENFRSPRNICLNNKEQAINYLNKFVLQNARYLLAYTDINAPKFNNGEILVVFKNKQQQLRFFDIRQQEIFDESVLEQIKYTYTYEGKERSDNIQLFRIDNLEFNPRLIRKML